MASFNQHRYWRERSNGLTYARKGKIVRPVNAGLEGIPKKKGVIIGGLRCALTLKKCTCCKEWFSVSNFHSDANRKDGLANRCKQCHNKHMQRYKKRNPERIKEDKRKYYEQNRDKIRQYYQDNREWLLARSRESRCGLDGSIKTMLASAKTRAKKRDWEFDIDEDYLLSIATEHCPVDGRPLDWDKKLSTNGRSSPTSPSLDRLDSSRGYVKGNVRIIGDQWNRWKSNMTLEDVEKLCLYMRQCFHCGEEE